MKTKIQAILIMLFFLVAESYAQTRDYEPMDLAQRIFSKEVFQELSFYSRGEYQGKPSGQDLSADVKTTFLLLGQSKKKAVIAMTILDTNGVGLDTYLHFEKDTIWKLAAFRALAMSGIIEMVKNELEKLTDKQVGSIITASKKKKKKKNMEGFSMFSSREEYEYELGNARLTLSLDQKIKEHFLDNKAAFE